MTSDRKPPWNTGKEYSWSSWDVRPGINDDAGSACRADGSTDSARRTSGTGEPSGGGGRGGVGAVGGFVGMIRDHDNGPQLVRLEYSAHPSAADVIAEVVADVA